VEVASDDDRGMLEGRVGASSSVVRPVDDPVPSVVGVPGRDLSSRPGPGAGPGLYRLNGGGPIVCRWWREMGLVKTDGCRGELEIVRLRS
jgi:hypothetical protein